MTRHELSMSGSASLYFSYGQILAFDSNEPQPGSIWTEQHLKQGFVRRPHSIGFGTLKQDGTATITVFRGRPVTLESYEQVVSVPIDLPSGVLRLEGPEEHPIERSITLKPGVFRLIVAQSPIDSNGLNVDLFIEEADEVDPRSAVLKSQYFSTIKLLETAESAG